jgi:hypothetical protein
MKLKLAGAILLSTLVLAGCRAEPVLNIQNEPFALTAAADPQTLTLDDYKNAIIRAGAARGWAFSDDGPGAMIGTVVVRGKHTAKVRVLYDEKAFSIVYLDSNQLNYDASRGEIHPNYNSWVRNLRNDIQTQITLAKAS